MNDYIQPLKFKFEAQTIKEKLIFVLSVHIVLPFLNLCSLCSHAKCKKSDSDRKVKSSGFKGGVQLYPLFLYYYIGDVWVLVAYISKAL